MFEVSLERIVENVHSPCKDCGFSLPLRPVLFIAYSWVPNSECHSYLKSASLNVGFSYQYFQRYESLISFPLLRQFMFALYGENKSSLCYCWTTPEIKSHYAETLFRSAMPLIFFAKITTNSIILFYRWFSFSWNMTELEDCP